MIFFVAQFLLVGLVLILPCVLMGGTLPILARWLVGREEEIGGRVGTLYAANTLGAAAGTAAATYVLLPRAGVREGELVAVGDQPRRRPDRSGAVPQSALGRVQPAAAGAHGHRRRERGRRPRREHRASRRDRALGLCLHGRRGRLGAAGLARVRELRLCVRIDAPSVPRAWRSAARSSPGSAAPPGPGPRIRAVAGTGRRAPRHRLGTPGCRGLHARFPGRARFLFATAALQILETAPVLLPLAIPSGSRFPPGIAATSDLAGWVAASGA